MADRVTGTLICDSLPVPFPQDSERKRLSASGLCSPFFYSQTRSAQRPDRTLPLDLLGTKGIGVHVCLSVYLYIFVSLTSIYPVPLGYKGQWGVYVSVYLPWVPGSSSFPAAKKVLIFPPYRWEKE